MTRAAILSVFCLIPLRAQLTLEDVGFRQYENGPFWTTDHAFFSGDQIFFDARLKGYTRTEGLDPRIELNWNIRLMDAEGRLLTQPKTGEIKAELAPEDADYRPRVRADFQLPLLLLPGSYRIETVVKDAVAKAEKKFTRALEVGGRKPEIGTALTANGFRFFRSDQDRRPLAEPVYRPGETVFVRFDISGYKLGERNKLEVGYGLLVLTPEAQPFLREENAARHETATFYPQLWVPAALEVKLPPTAQAGAYVMLITVRDYVGNQTEAVRTGFTVAP